MRDSTPRLGGDAGDGLRERRDLTLISTSSSPPYLWTGCLLDYSERETNES